MRSRAFLILIAGLLSLVIVTSPPLLQPLLWPPPTPTVTPTPQPATPTATPTLDPFANVPTATPLSQPLQGAISARLPTPELGAPPPTFTPPPSPSSTPAALTLVLPHLRATPAPTLPSPPDSNRSPTRLQIPRLELDIPIEPVGLVASTPDPNLPDSNLVEPALPAAGYAGWLFHADHPLLILRLNDFGELTSLQAGDELQLLNEQHPQLFVVTDTVTLQEQDLSSETRLAQARFLQPAGQAALILIGVGPPAARTDYVVVTARLKQSSFGNSSKPVYLCLTEHAVRNT